MNPDFITFPTGDGKGAIFVNVHHIRYVDVPGWEGREDQVRIHFGDDDYVWSKCTFAWAMRRIEKALGVGSVVKGTNRTEAELCQQ